METLLAIAQDPRYQVISITEAFVAEKARYRVFLQQHEDSNDPTIFGRKMLEEFLDRADQVTTIPEIVLIYGALRSYGG